MNSTAFNSYNPEPICKYNIHTFKTSNNRDARTRREMESKLPKSVRRQSLLLLNTSRRLPLRRRQEEQTRSFTRFDQMTQIPSMGRVTIILNILSVGRVRETIRKFSSFHNLRLLQLCRFLLIGSAQSFEEEVTTTLLRPRQRVEWMRLRHQDPFYRRICVKPGCDGSAGGFNGGNGICRGARNDDVDGLFETFFLAASEQFYAVAELVHAVGVEEFADCDRVFGVDATLVDPFLDFIEVDGYEVGGPAIVRQISYTSKHERE